MIRFLVLIVMLWAGVGWAEDRAHDPFACRDGQIVTGYVGFNVELRVCVKNQWETMQTHCEIQMEAAMRAMEKQFYYQHDGRMIFPFKPDGEPIPVSVEPLIRQWAEAKACWRKP